MATLLPHPQQCLAQCRGHPFIVVWLRFRALASDLRLGGVTDAISLSLECDEWCKPFLSNLLASREQPPQAPPQAPQAPPAQAAQQPPAQQATRKRLASAALAANVASKTFQQCWDDARVQKHRRFVCTKDFLTVVGTSKAVKFIPQLAQRLETWANWDKYPWDSSAYEQIAKFRKPGRGGSAPYGTTRAATKDIYNCVSGRRATE